MGFGSGTRKVAEEAIELRNEEGFTALKLRLGRENARDDLRAIHAVRVSVGDAFRLMVDFNQGLDLSEALHRCHAIDDLGLEWIEEPIVTTILTASRGFLPN
jgi:mandelate racemase